MDVANASDTLINLLGLFQSIEKSECLRACKQNKDCDFAAFNGILCKLYFQLAFNRVVASLNMNIYRKI
jgi:hypothetical protein